MSQLPDSVTEPRLGLLAVFVPGGPKSAGQLAGDSLSELQKGPWNLGIDGLPTAATRSTMPSTA